MYFKKESAVIIENMELLLSIFVLARASCCVTAGILKLLGNNSEWMWSIVSNCHGKTI
jgi:hypothetical protein